MAERWRETLTQLIARDLSLDTLLSGGQEKYITRDIKTINRSRKMFCRWTWSEHTGRKHATTTLPVNTALNTAHEYLCSNRPSYQIFIRFTIRVKSDDINY